MSLYICSSEALTPDRIEPVPLSYSGAAAVGMTLTPLDPKTIALDPYPLDQRPLTTNVIFRRLTQQSSRTPPICKRRISRQRRKSLRSGCAVGGDILTLWGAPSHRGSIANRAVTSPIARWL